MAENFLSSANEPEVVTPESARADLAKEQAKQRESESYLRWGVGQVYDLFDGPAASVSRDDVKALQQETERLKSRNSWESGSAEFVKSACLFLPGGRWTTASVFAADQARLADDWKLQLLDGTLGFAKGAVTKTAFDFAGKINNVGGKALAMGLGSRVIDIGLTRESYRDLKTGEYAGFGSWSDAGTSLTNVGKNLWLGAVNPTSLTMDIAIMGSAHYGMKGLAALDKGLGTAMAKSPYLNTTLTGTTFGLMTGFMQDLHSQYKEGHTLLNLDLWRLGENTVRKGAIDTLAAATAGGFARVGASFKASERQASVPELTRSEKPVRASDSPVEHATDSLRRIIEAGQERPSGIFERGLDAAEPSVLELSRRITGYTVENIPFRVSSGASNVSFESPTAYQETATKVVEVPSRVYSIEGHDTKIVVPESYARQQDAVLSVRLQLEGGEPIPGTQRVNLHMLDRALPVDMVRILDDMVDSSLVESIVLHPEPASNPMDRWHAKAAGEPGFVSAASANELNRSIDIFGRNNDASLPKEFTHEFTHLLKAAYPVESRLYDIASALEKTLPRPRAGVDAHENWSVGVGECILSPDRAVFREFAEHSPVKTWIASQALAKALDRSGTNGPAQQEIAERLKIVEREIKPKAIEQLMQAVRSGSPDVANPATRLLVTMGEGSHLRPLTLDILDLSGEPIGDWHLANLNGLRARHVNLSGVPEVTKLDWLSPQSVESLNLAGTRVRDGSLWILESAPNLRYLDLRGTNVGNGALGYLSAAKDLNTLVLRGTQMDAPTVARLQSRLPDTRILHAGQSIGSSVPPDMVHALTTPKPVADLTRQHATDRMPADTKPISAAPEVELSADAGQMLLAMEAQAKPFGMRLKNLYRGAKALGPAEFDKTIDFLLARNKTWKGLEADVRQRIREEIKAKLDEQFAPTQKELVVKARAQAKENGECYLKDLKADVIVGDGRTLTVEEVVRNLNDHVGAETRAKLERHGHDLEAYADAIKDSSFAHLKPVRVLGVGFESVAIQMDNGMVLKLTRQVVDVSENFESWGTRPGDAPLFGLDEHGKLEPGKISELSLPGDQVLLAYLQPAAETMEAKILAHPDLRRFLKTLPTSKEWDDTSAEQFGIIYDGPHDRVGHLVLLDYGAVK